MVWGVSSGRRALLCGRAEWQCSTRCGVVDHLWICGHDRRTAVTGCAEVRPPLMAGPGHSTWLVGVGCAGGGEAGIDGAGDVWAGES